MNVSRSVGKVVLIFTSAMIIFISAFYMGHAGFGSFVCPQNILMRNEKASHAVTKKISVPVFSFNLLDDGVKLHKRSQELSWAY
jgi:hypothetical protein